MSDAHSRESGREAAGGTAGAETVTRLEEAVKRLEQLTRLVFLQQQADYRQLEALSSLLAALRPRLPLPAMRGWAISPDFAALLYRLVRTLRPAVVVETGSGVSSLVIGYALEANGQGRLSSLEHLERFARASTREVREHGLEPFVEVLHAPLRETPLKDERFRWYDLSRTVLPESIDLLVIDGPPAETGRLARYPALPLLFSRLSPRAVIVLDDARREDEREAVRRWVEAWPELEPESLETEKGAIVVRRR